MEKNLIERTLVLVKPDGVKRGLIGEILHRFERAGLKIVAMKMVWVDKDHVAKHYPEDRTELMKAIGTNTLESYEKHGLNPKEMLGTDDAIEIGKVVNGWNREFIASGPVVAMVIEGHGAIAGVRMIIGPTLPALAPSGTIRGDYSIDSPALANSRKRNVRNLTHASGNTAEATYEIDLWFTPKEIHDYKRTDEDVMFGNA